MKVRIAAAARRDVREAARYYNEARAGWGKTFIARVRECIAEIRSFPKLAREIDPGVRAAFLNQFPFKIYYTLSKDEALIIAVLHAYRDPDTWMTRA